VVLKRVLSPCILTCSIVSGFRESSSPTVMATTVPVNAMMLPKAISLCLAMGASDRGRARPRQAHLQRKEGSTAG
jgi:hypothetical protein